MHPALIITSVYGVALFMFICWVRHIAWSISLLVTDTGQAIIPIGKYVLAAIGVFAPPIGTIHGFMLFFGLA